MNSDESNDNAGHDGSDEDSLQKLFEFGKSSAVSSVPGLRYQRPMLLDERGAGGWDSYMLAEVMTPAQKSDLGDDFRENAVVRYLIVAELNDVVTVVAVERDRTMAAVGEVERTTGGRRLKGFEAVPARSVERLTEMLPRIEA